MKSNTPIPKVIELFISQTKEPKRVSKQLLKLDENGVCEDKFYAKDIARSVMIVSLHSYLRAKQQGIDISFGQLGENILVDFNPYHLQANSQLQIGKTILEITQKAPLCPGLSKLDSRLPKLLKEDRGIFAKVIVSGEISIADKIYIL